MAYFFVVAAIILRLIPHVANFAPIAALALFGGVYLNKKYALIIPLVAMLISDAIIGFYNPLIMLSVYGSFTIIALLGLWLKRNKNILNVISVTLAGSTIFYLITNFAVWVVPHSFYSKNLQGLILCYTMGLPFFKNTFLGDLFYVGTIFLLMETVLKITHTWQIKAKKEVNGFCFKRMG